MTVLDDIVAALRADPSVHAVYLTTSALGPVGSSGNAQPGDLQSDTNAHVIAWDSAEDVLAVDTREQRNGKIASLRDFLARRRDLWLTAVDITDPTAHTELVTRSAAVAALLATDAKQRKLARRLWWAVLLALLVLGAAVYYYCYRSPSRTSQSQSSAARLPALPPPLFLSRRK